MEMVNLFGQVAYLLGYFAPFLICIIVAFIVARKNTKAAWIVFWVGSLITLVSLILGSLIFGGTTTYWIIYGVVMYICVFFLGS